MYPIEPLNLRRKMENKEIIKEICTVIRNMTAIVMEEGFDYVYKKKYGGSSDAAVAVCRYSIDGKPDCLIGRVLYRMGWLTEDLNAIEGSSIAHLPTSKIPQGVWVPQERTRKVMYAAQHTQDTGMPWGRALAEAVKSATTHIEELVNE